MAEAIAPQSSPLALLGDRFAIVLSGLCIAHCLTMPLLLSVIPWLSWMHEHEPLVHRLLLLVIVPLSASMLLRGCAKHSRYFVLWLGAIALACLLSAVLLTGFSHTMEITLTALGSVGLIGSHLLNMRGLKALRAGK